MAGLNCHKDGEGAMNASNQASREMRELAKTVLDVIAKHSAGELGRRQNWGYFVQNIRSGYTLMELTETCVDALSDDQRRMLLAKLSEK